MMTKGLIRYGQVLIKQPNDQNQVPAHGAGLCEEVDAHLADDVAVGVALKQ